jgi:hypothetical protein
MRGNAARSAYTEQTNAFAHERTLIAYAESGSRSVVDATAYLISAGHTTTI